MFAGCVCVCWKSAFRGQSLLSSCGSSESSSRCQPCNECFHLLRQLAGPDIEMINCVWHEVKSIFSSFSDTFSGAICVAHQHCMFLIPFWLLWSPGLSLHPHWDCGSWSLIFVKTPLTFWKSFWSLFVRVCLILLAHRLSVCFYSLTDLPVLQAFFPEHCRCFFVKILKGVMGIARSFVGAVHWFPVVFAIMSSRHAPSHGTLEYFAD